MKVLIVDDESGIVDYLSEYIRETFLANIDTAENGLDAFLLCRDYKYDLIITDHKMPYMLGSALVVAVRTKKNENKETPFILLSAYINDELKASMNVPKLEFATKPIDEDELREMLTTHLC